VIGRAAERQVIDGLLGAARGPGTSGSLVIAGSPGSGRSTLLDHAASTAGELRILRAEGVETEADLAFAGLHRLLRPVLDVLPALPEAQATALGAALGLSAQPPSGVDRFLVGAGVLSLLAEVAGAGPGLLCLVDDAHWLDPESAVALTFAARRLAEEGVVTVFATRSGDRSFDPPGITRLELEPLSRAESLEVLAAGAHPLAASVRERIAGLSGGNPLALVELPRALTPAQRRGTEPLPATLDLGEPIRVALRSQLDLVSEPARRMLLIPALEPSAGLGVIEQVAGRLGLPMDALDEAESAGLITVSAGGVRFSTSLLRSAIAGDAPYLRRRAVHGALADALSETAPERWAWHRAAIADGTDPVLADELERSADRSGHRIGFAALAAALERSAQLTVDDALRARRLVRAAGAAWRAGQGDRAAALLDDAENRTGATDHRAMVLRAQMRKTLAEPGRAVPLLRDAAELLADDHPDEAIAALTEAMEAAAVAGDFSLAPELAAIAARVAEGQAVPLTGLLSGLARLTQGDATGAAADLQAFRAYAQDHDDPLYISWSNAKSPLLTPWRAWFGQFPREQTPAWVNVTTNEYAPYMMAGGLLAVRDLTMGQTVGEPDITANDDYYSASLKMLVWISEQ